MLHTLNLAVLQLYAGGAQSGTGLGAAGQCEVAEHPEVVGVVGVLGGLAGSVLGGVAGDVIKAVAGAIADAVGKAVAAVGTLWVRVGTPNLTAVGAGRRRIRWRSCSRICGGT